MNAKDTDDDVVIGVAKHYPETIRSKTTRSDIYFDMKIRTRDNKTVIKYLPYALVKELKVVKDYIWSVKDLNRFAPRKATRSSKKNVSTSVAVV